MNAPPNCGRSRILPIFETIIETSGQHRHIQNRLLSMSAAFLFPNANRSPCRHDAGTGFYTWPLPLFALTRRLGLSPWRAFKTGKNAPIECNSGLSGRARNRRVARLPVSSTRVEEGLRETSQIPGLSYQPTVRHQTLASQPCAGADCIAVTVDFIPRRPSVPSPQFVASGQSQHLLRRLNRRVIGNFCRNFKT